MCHYNPAMDAPVTIFLPEPVREILSHPENFLGRSEYRVVAAYGHDVELEVVRELGPSLAVIEDGSEDAAVLCRRLKVDEATKQVILLVTAPKGSARSAFLREAGADDVMVAPFSPVELLGRIGDLLSIPVSQRRHVRALFGVSFDGKSVTGTFLGNTVNISEGGMLIESDQELELGERLECRFFLPGDQKPVDVKGKVVRRAPEVQGQMPAFGVVFQSVTDEDMARLRAYVASQAP